MKHIYPFHSTLRKNNPQIVFSRESKERLKTATQDWRLETPGCGLALWILDFEAPTITSQFLKIKIPLCVSHLLVPFLWRTLTNTAAREESSLPSQDPTFPFPSYRPALQTASPLLYPWVSGTRISISSNPQRPTASTLT